MSRAYLTLRKLVPSSTPNTTHLFSFTSVLSPISLESYRHDHCSRRRRQLIAALSGRCVTAKCKPLHTRPGRPGSRPAEGAPLAFSYCYLRRPPLLYEQVLKTYSLSHLSAQGVSLQLHSTIDHNLRHVAAGTVLTKYMWDHDA